MYALKSLRSARVPFLAAAGAGLVALAASTRKNVVPRYGEVETPEGTEDVEKQYLRPTPAGPMVAVYLDDISVQALHKLYPDTREARLRKAVIQYDPSDEDRAVYEPLFGGTATVKLSGEANSAGRRALAASVSFGGRPVKPQSLSCAIDVTAGKHGGGPLGSTVLIEQIKRAGAIKETTWKGTLPPLLVHHRHFPREDGEYKRLEDPLTVTGSVCRADWVDGSTTRCRMLVEGDEERRGWTPSGCILCNILLSSPCCDIFTKLGAVSKRLMQAEKEANGEQDGESSGAGAGGEDADGDGDDGVDKANAGKQGVRASSGGGEVNSERSAEELEAEELRHKQLMGDMVAAIVEMSDCTDFYDVFADAEADAGMDSREEEEETGELD